MGRTRTELVAAVRQDLATARGAARAVLAAAESARAEAHRQRDVVRQAYGTCLAQLAQARDAARLDILRRFHRESAALSGTAEILAAACASGAASSSWRAWSPTEPGRDRRPGLFRIGLVAYDPPPLPGQSSPARRTVLPALVPLLDHAHLELSGEQSAVDNVVAGLLLRALGSTRPGDIRLSIFGLEQLGGTLGGFAPLANADLLSFVEPDGLSAMLDELVGHIERIDESVLGGEFGSLTELTAATAGRRPEPWRVAVLLGDPATATGLTDAQRAALDRIVRTGVACGVHVIARGLWLPDHPSVERITVRGATATCDTTGDLPVRLDPAPPSARLAGFCRGLAERLLAGPPPASFADLEPEKLWTESSAHALVAPLGDSPDGGMVQVLLGDDPAHALIGGPSGSGKTNLIHAWLGALATRYGPDELALYLLDAGRGESFTRFAPTPRDPSWLPQVRLVGLNAEQDRELGVALLRHLGDELSARVRAAGRYAATSLAGLRGEEPGGRWPRIVAVIDEVPGLLAGRDAMAGEAVRLLAELARRGGAHGIHLVLTAQDVGGIEALWGRPDVVRHFALRIAMPRARTVLAEDNLAADVIPRLHAVVNAHCGVATANRVVRLPDAGDRSAWRSLQEKLWHARPDHLAAPWVFDGDAVPAFPRRPGPPARRSEAAGAVALLGELVDVHRRPAEMTLRRTDGGNLAVLGTRTDEACDVLAAAALSLAEQGPRRFSVVCLDPAAEAAAGALRAALPDARWFDAATAPELMAQLADEVRAPATDTPHYVIGYAWDADGAPPAAEVADVLARGPHRGVHVLGWWRAVSGPPADPAAIGTWVALDVPGNELAALSPQPGGPAWTPRRRRALFFDRSAHRAPAVMIPYEVRL